MFLLTDCALKQVFMASKHLLSPPFIVRVGLEAHRVQKEMSFRLSCVPARSRVGIHGKKGKVCSLVSIILLPTSTLLVYPRLAGHGSPRASSCLRRPGCLQGPCAATGSCRICPRLWMPGVCFSSIPASSFAAHMALLFSHWNAFHLNLTSWGPGPLYNFHSSRDH